MSDREAPSNIPVPLTSFVGREQELAELGRLLSGVPPAARLVTLTGSGGVGKTRLALQIASELLRARDFPDGAWLVELAPLADPLRLAQVVAAVFALQEEPGRTFTDVLVDALRARRLLLVLDNCEHLADACAELAHALLSACPGVTILATSREPLRLTGEVLRRVLSLERPDPRNPPPLERLRQYEAVRLFADRAAAASAEFEVTEHNAAAVVQVCGRLDGIPLALELAAARMRALTVDQIAARLDNCFRLLGKGSRVAPPRQQTLEATVAWSYDLLHEDEQRLFRRLAVFAGGWTLEAAESVCATVEPGGSVLDLLAQLIEKSLVLAEDGPDGGKWYRLLETIRQFAIERLRACGEEEEIRERHFQWYLELSKGADRTIRWTPGIPWQIKQGWLVRLGWEYANLRAAYQWALKTMTRTQPGLRLATALFTFFWTTGYLSEGRDWLATLLARDAGAPPTALRAWALSVAAKLASHHGDDAAGQPLAREYLGLPASLWTDPAGAQVHTALGLAALREGDLLRARAHATTALNLARVGDKVSAPLYVTYVAAVAHAEGQLDEAQALYEQALAEGRTDDFPLPIGLALDGLARIARERGDRRRARALYEEALGLLSAIGAMPQMALLLVALGHLDLEDGNVVQARSRLGEGLQLASTLGQRDALVVALEGVALLLTRPGVRERGAMDRALRLLGAIAALREGTRLPPPTEAARQASTHARSAVGDARAEALMAEGRALAREQAVEQAKAALAEGGSAGSGLTDSAASSLTRREREVAILLARGCSNHQIADALVIGKRTAEMHVGHLRAKLGLASRAQVAVWAVQHGLVDAESGVPAPTPSAPDLVGT
jgi:predicted ATPase/DNA-binding CsgD family transcriptional regulator